MVRSHRPISTSFFSPARARYFFAFFRLGFERPDPFLQFLHDIPQPEQIILRRVQPPFSLVFAVTVFGNTGGLLKKTPGGPPTWRPRYPLIFPWLMME